MTPLLRENDASTETGRALFEAGAEQLYLLGWKAYDDGQHPLAQRYLVQAPWMAIYPGLMIFGVVMSLNVVGDALRDALDPKHQ